MISYLWFWASLSIIFQNFKITYEKENRKIKSLFCVDIQLNIPQAMILCLSANFKWVPLYFFDSFHFSSSTSFLINVVPKWKLFVLLVYFVPMLPSDYILFQKKGSPSGYIFSTANSIFKFYFERKDIASTFSSDCIWLFYSSFFLLFIFIKNFCAWERICEPVLVPTKSDIFFQFFPKSSSPFVSVKVTKEKFLMLLFGPAAIDSISFRRLVLHFEGIWEW